MDKKNIPLVLALALPLLVLVIVLFNNLTVHSSFHPNYNFIFSLNAFGYDYKSNRLVVSKKKLFVSDSSVSTNAPDKKDNFKLFIYDVAQEKARPITLSEAQTYDLDTNVASPDHYTVKKGYEMDRGPPSLFFFGNSDDSTVYLVGHDSLKAIRLDMRHYWDFEFIGWIINDKK